MIKTLYVVSILCLIGAGLLFVLSGVQWLAYVPLNERDPRIPVTERLRGGENLNGNTGVAAIPLLEQAEAFALYLNPPRPPPPARREISQPVISSPPAPRPANPTPQFRILAISYYRSSPDKSLAMVWDASKGGYWIKKGDRLGHFVVERIEKEAVVYRDGDQLRQMVVAVKQPVQLARLKSRESASLQDSMVAETLVSASP